MKAFPVLVNRGTHWLNVSTMRAGYHEILYQKEYVIQPENHSWESHGGQGQQYVSRKASTCYSSTSRNMASCFSTTSTGGLASSISPFADTEDPSIIKARNQSKLVACYPEPHRVHLNSYPRQRIIEHNYINEHHANSYHSQHMSDDRQVLNREHSDEGKRLIYVPFNQKFKTEEQVPHERTYIQNIKGNQRTERALYQQDLRDPQPQYNPPFRPQSEKSAYQQIYIESAQTVRAPFEQTVRDFSQHDRTKHASAILENQHVDIHAYKRIVGATQYGGFQYEKNPRETSHANIALYRQSFKESQQEVFPSKQNFREGDIALTEQFSKQSQFANMSSYKQTYYRESPHDMVSYKQPKESTQVVKVMYGKQNFRETPSPDLNPHVAMHYKRKFGETSHTEIPPPKRPLRESQQVDTETHSHSLKECPLPYKRTSRRTQKADMDIDGHVQRESLVQFQQQLRETLGPDPCKLHYRETQHDDIASNEQLLRESPQCESVARKHMPRRSPPAYKPQLKESPKVNRIRDAHLLRPPPPLVRVAEDVPRNTDTSPTLSRRQGFVSHEVSSRKTDVSPIPPSECTFLEGFEEKRIDHYRHHASSVSCAERVSPTKEEMCDLSDVHSQGRRRSIHCILDLTKTSVKEKRKSLCKETAENPHFKKDGFTGNVMSHTSKSESATSMTANHSQSPNITESAITSNCVSTNVLRNSSRSDSTQVTNNGRVSTSRNTALPQPPPLRQLDDRENPSTNADERSPQTCLKRSHSYSEVHEVTKNVSVHRTNSEGSPAQTPKRQPEAVRRGKDGSVEKGHAASCGGYAYDHGTLPIIIAVHSMAMDETGSNVNSKKIWETVLKTATSTLSCSKSKSSSQEQGTPSISSSPTSVDKLVTERTTRSSQNAKENESTNATRERVHKKKHQPSQKCIAVATTIQKTEAQERVNEIENKIINTRRKIEREKIAWKKKLLRRLENVLNKKLIRAERETKTKATIDLGSVNSGVQSKTESKTQSSYYPQAKRKNRKRSTEKRETLEISTQTTASEIDKEVKSKEVTKSKESSIDVSETEQAHNSTKARKDEHGVTLTPDDVEEVETVVVVDRGTQWEFCNNNGPNTMCTKFT